MLSNHLYLASAGVSSRLDGAMLEQDKLFGVLSIEYLDPTPLGDEMLQLVRHCAQLLGHWQPVQEESASDLALPAELHQLTGIDTAKRCCNGPKPPAVHVPAGSGVPATGAGSLDHSPLRPQRGDLLRPQAPQMDPGPGRELFQHGQAIYVEDLALRYPKAHRLRPSMPGPISASRCTTPGVHRPASSPCCSTRR